MIELVEPKEHEIPRAGVLLEQMWDDLASSEEITYREKLFEVPGAEYIKQYIVDGGWCVVAKIDGVIVGALLYMVIDADEYVKHNKELYVDEVSVDTAYRQMGIGTAFLSFCEQEAQRLGIDVMTAKVWSYNKPSSSMLNKFGMKPSHTIYRKVI